MRKINKIEPLMPVLPTRKKVAAYARVSMETERLHHSLSAQVSYYSELIQANPEWEYVGVYADATDIIGANQKTFNQQGDADLLLLFFCQQSLQIKSQALN